MQEFSEIASALSEFQGECPAPPKDAKVEFGNRKYSYADLATIIKTVQPYLKKHGLSFVQLVEDKFLVTRLFHKSGQSLVGKWELRSSGGPQEQGSEFTYIRRYSLQAMLGIAAEEDDDGAAASEPKNKVPQKPNLKEPPKLKVTEAQIKRLYAICSARKWTHDEAKEYMFAVFGVESSKDLDRDQYDQFISVIEKFDPGSAFGGIKP